MSGRDSNGVFAYAAPFPSPWQQPFPVVPVPPQDGTGVSFPLVPASPLTEQDMRRIIREELQVFKEESQRELQEVIRTAKPLDQVLCDLGDAHLLEVHPMEDPPGAD